MFTGLVEKMATIRAIQKLDRGAQITIDADELAAGVEIGDSICVNGCCLTVVEIAGSELSFDVVEESLKRTNLGSKNVDDQVNIERSLAVGDRMGGHFVTGHIDGLATLTEMQRGELWSTYRFTIAPEHSIQMASKGSVTVDGVSLTLVDVEDGAFSIALIPHTLIVTTLGSLHEGDHVNIETDVLAKYVQRQLAGGALPGELNPTESTGN